MHFNRLMNPGLVRVIPVFESIRLRMLDVVAAQERRIVNIALFLWLVIVITTALHHEMWRDEVRALSMALEAGSMWDIFATLRNEGHPFLWYWILRSAYWLWPTPVVLQVASILIGFAAVTLFLKKSPFPLIVRLLFIFGTLPLVNYSVFARNYGISMLLYFLFADVYSRPERKNYLVALILVLLANTNYLAMMFSGILVCLWAVEEYLKVRDFQLFFRRFIFPATLAMAGIILALFTIMMDANSSQAPPDFVASRDYFRPMLDSALHPGRFFSELMAATPPVRDMVLFGLLAGLLASPLYAGSLYVSIFMFNLFSSTIIPPNARHQGVLLMLIVALYWIVVVRNRREAKRDVPLTIAIYLVLAPLFYHQIALANMKISEEVQREMSSSAALGKFINTNRQLNDAVIMGDPDYLLGPLTYHVRNRIYFVRESRYGTYERYVKVPKNYVTLLDLIEAAEHIRDSEHVPVLILLQHWDIPKEDTYSAYRVHGREFHTNRAEVLEFSEKTIKIAEFNNAVSDENYEVFLLPKTTKEDYFRSNGDYRQRLELLKP